MSEKKNQSLFCVCIRLRHRVIHTTYAQHTYRLEKKESHGFVLKGPYFTVLDRQTGRQTHILSSLHNRGEDGTPNPNFNYYKTIPRKTISIPIPQKLIYSTKHITKPHYTVALLILSPLSLSPPTIFIQLHSQSHSPSSSLTILLSISLFLLLSARFLLGRNLQQKWPFC